MTKRKKAVDLRQELERRNAEHGTEFHMLLNEDEAFDLSRGIVPRTVKSMAHTMLDWLDEDDRKERDKVFLKKHK